MEISRYASRLAPTSRVLPSGRPQTQNAPPSKAQADSKLSDSLTFPVESLAGLANFPKDLPDEPDDAQLTGGTRSLSRRLLALNFSVLPAASLPQVKTASERHTDANIGPSVIAKSGMRKSMVRKAIFAKNGLVA